MLEVKVYSIKEWDLAGRKKQILRKFNKVHVPNPVQQHYHHRCQQNIVMFEVTSTFDRWMLYIDLGRLFALI